MRAEHRCQRKRCDRLRPVWSCKRHQAHRRKGLVTIPVAEKGQKTIYVLPAQASFAVAQIDGTQTASGVRVVVPDGVATLHVRAKTTDDVPLAGVGLILRYAGTELPSSVLASLAFQRQLYSPTDTSGELRLPALPAGAYEIAWTQQGQTAAPGQWTRVELGAGETLITQTFSRGKT